MLGRSLRHCFRHVHGECLSVETARVRGRHVLVVDVPLGPWLTVAPTGEPELRHHLGAQGFLEYNKLDVDIGIW